MKRLLHWISLLAVMFSLSSCGLPGALGRTTGNLYKNVSNLIPSASASGGLGPS
jgi:hypothetical protein